MYVAVLFFFINKATNEIALFLVGSQTHAGFILSFINLRLSCVFTYVLFERETLCLFFLKAIFRSCSTPFRFALHLFIGGAECFVSKFETKILKITPNVQKNYEINYRVVDVN